MNAVAHGDLSCRRRGASRGFALFPHENLRETTYGRQWVSTVVCVLTSVRKWYVSHGTEVAVAIVCDIMSFPTREFINDNTHLSCNSLL